MTSLHVPFMLKCFFINVILIIIVPLHTLLTRAHQLQSARLNLSHFEDIHTANTQCLRK